MRRNFFSKQGKGFQQNSLLRREENSCFPHEILLAANVAHITISAPNYNVIVVRR
jgi:hypothetical protein